MIHLLCAALVLVGLVIVDLRASRRAVVILDAINPLRSAAPIEDDDEGEDEGGMFAMRAASPANDGRDEGAADEDGEGGMLATIEFGDEGEPPTAVVALTLDASTTERVDEAVAAVRAEGDRPSGSWPAFRPSPPPDDDPA